MIVDRVDIFEEKFHALFAMYSLRYVARGDKDINSRRIEKSSGIERIGTRSTTGRSPDNGHRNRFSNRSNRVVSCKEF